MHTLLMDGTPSGPKECTLDNWNGIAYIIPRTHLSEVSPDYLEASCPGVYLLLGEDDEGNPMLYVGQATRRDNGNGTLERVIEHTKNRRMDFFTTAILLVDGLDRFSGTLASCLEREFYRLALNAGRMKLANRLTPGDVNADRFAKSASSRFVNSATTLLRCMGYTFFDPIGTDAPPQEDPTPSATRTEPELHMSGHGYHAEGKRLATGFVVHSGAQLSPTIAPSAPKKVHTDRERFADHIDDAGRLTTACEFASPSRAAAFVRGMSTNGPQTWKTASGKTLGEMEAAYLGH